MLFRLELEISVHLEHINLGVSAYVVRVIMSRIVHLQSNETRYFPFGKVYERLVAKLNGFILQWP